MKTILKLILSAIILFGAVPTVNAMDMKMDNMEEIKSGLMFLRVRENLKKALH